MKKMCFLFLLFLANTFMLLAQPPTVVTYDIQNLGHYAVDAHGEVTNDGAFTPYEVGFVWSTSPNPDLSNNEGTLSQTGGSLKKFMSIVDGLTENTTYYVRAYAISQSGPGYGSDVEFTTLFGEQNPPNGMCTPGAFSKDFNNTGWNTGHATMNASNVQTKSFKGMYSNFKYLVGYGKNMNNNWYVWAERYDENGMKDNGFGDNGIFTRVLPTVNKINYNVNVQFDKEGNLFIGLNTETDGNMNIHIINVWNHGQINPLFGNNGVLELDFSTDRLAGILLHNNEMSLVCGIDGEIFIAHFFKNGKPNYSKGEDGLTFYQNYSYEGYLEVIAAKLNPKGNINVLVNSWDNGFAKTGIATLDMMSYEGNGYIDQFALFGSPDDHEWYGHDFAIDRFNRVYITGVENDAMGNKGMLLLRTSGNQVSLDWNFANNGFLIRKPMNGNAMGNAVDVDPNCGIVVGGEVDNLSTSGIDMALWAFERNGMPNMMFGDNGRKIIDRSMNDACTDLEFVDGKILYAGRKESGSSLIESEIGMLCCGTSHLKNASYISFQQKSNKAGVDNLGPVKISWLPGNGIGRIVIATRKTNYYSGEPFVPVDGMTYDGPGINQVDWSNAPVAGNNYESRIIFSSSNYVWDESYQFAFLHNLEAGAEYVISIFEYDEMMNYSHEMTVNNPRALKIAPIVNYNIYNIMPQVMSDSEVKVNWEFYDNMYSNENPYPLEGFLVDFTSYANFNNIGINENDPYYFGTSSQAKYRYVDIGMTRSYIFTDLTPETAHYFRVAGYNYQVDGSMWYAFNDGMENIPIITYAPQPDAPTGGRFTFRTENSLAFEWNNEEGVQGIKNVNSTQNGGSETKFLVLANTMDMFGMPQDGVGYGAGNTDMTMASQPFGQGQGYLVHNGTATEAQIQAMVNDPNGTVHFFKIYSYNGNNGTENYNPNPVSISHTTIASYVATELTEVTSEYVGDSMYRLSWTSEDYDTDSKVLVMGSPNDTPPNLFDGISYGGQGTCHSNLCECTDEYCVVSNPSMPNSSIYVNIPSGVTKSYHFFTYYGMNYSNATTSGEAMEGSEIYTYSHSVSITGLASEPNSPVDVMITGRTTNSLDVEWTAPEGGADRYLVVVSDTEDPINAPMDTQTYLNGDSYEHGNQSVWNFHVWNETMINGSIVYNGTGTSTTVGGLDPNKVYRVEVFAFNYNVTGNENYNPMSGKASQVTFAEKPTMVLNLSNSNVDFETATLTWDNPENEEVLIFSSTTTNLFTPMQGNEYMGANPNWSMAANIGGSKFLYSGNGNTVDLTNLKVNTTYYFVAYKVNGMTRMNGMKSQNYSDASDVTSFTTLARPEATSLRFSSYPSELAENGTAFNVTIEVLDQDENVFEVTSDLSVQIVSNNTTVGTGTITAGNSSVNISVTPNYPDGAVGLEFSSTNGNGLENDMFTIDVKANAPSNVTGFVVTNNNESRKIKSSWTIPSDASGVMVYLRKLSANTVTPVDGNDYSTVTFDDGNSGSQLVLKGNQTSLEVTGLERFKRYYVKVFTYRGTDAAIRNYASSGLEGSASVRNKEGIENDDEFVSDFTFEVAPIYPNPSNGSINLNLTNNTNDAITIKVFSLDGQEVATPYLNHNFGSGFFNLIIDLPSNLAMGTYIVTISNGSEMIMEQIQIQK